LQGNPISITNLHQQLASPIEVLKNTIGDAPLAMKIVFNEGDEGRVDFDLQRTTEVDPENSRKRVTASESDLNLPHGSHGGSQNEYRDDVVEEEEDLGQRLVTSDQHEEIHDVSPMSRPARHSWTETDFIPVHPNYNRT
jgi:hypothetical protein